ncbi:UNVERIFIED_CONTAM: hypothetical protein FKN15_009543 [Acipenser sinensis]
MNDLTTGLLFLTLTRLRMWVQSEQEIHEANFYRDGYQTPGADRLLQGGRYK